MQIAQRCFVCAANLIIFVHSYLFFILIFSFYLSTAYLFFLHPFFLATLLSSFVFFSLFLASSHVFQSSSILYSHSYYLVSLFSSLSPGHAVQPVILILIQRPSFTSLTLCIFHYTDTHSSLTVPHRYVLTNIAILIQYPTGGMLKWKCPKESC